MAAEAANRPPLTVGYYLNPKKMKNFLFVFNNSEEQSSIVFRPLDLDADLTEQGPFDALLIKPEIAIENKNDPGSHRLNTLTEFLRGLDPECPVIEPLERIAIVLDRRLIMETLDAAHITIPDGSVVCSPRFALGSPEILEQWIMDPASIGLRFPVICKPIQACGSRDSHQMIVVPTPECLTELRTLSSGWVIQEYVNHEGIVYKVYVMGELCEAECRDSLPNFVATEDAARTCFHFNSQDKLSEVRFSLASTEKNVEDGDGDGAVDRPKSPTRRRIPDERISEEGWHSMASQMRACLGMDLFGFDVIVNSSTKQRFIVDVNYFPSYKNVQQLPEKLCSFIRSRVENASVGKR